MNEYEIAGIVGGCLSLAWVAAYIFSWSWSRIWSWVDDSERDSVTPLIRWLMYKRGYKDRNSAFFPFEKKGSGMFSGTSDGTGPFFDTLLGLFMLPMTVVIAFKLYPVAIAIVTSYAIAHLARYARRHKKVFDEHVADKKAHKETK